MKEKNWIIKKTAYAYLGPNIPGGILQTGSVYISNKPEHLNEIYKKIPEIQELFVEIQDVIKFKTKLQQKGSEEHRLYETVEYQVRKGNLYGI